MRVHLAHAGQPVQAGEQQVRIGIEIARHDDQQEVLRPEMPWNITTSGMAQTASWKWRDDSSF